MAVFSTAATNRPNQSFLFPSQSDPDTLTTTPSSCFISFFEKKNLIIRFDFPTMQRTTADDRVHPAPSHFNQIRFKDGSFTFVALLLTQVNGESQQAHLV